MGKEGRYGKGRKNERGGREGENLAPPNVFVWPRPCK